MMHILIAGVLAMAAPFVRSLANGDQVSWDGTYYDFRDAKGLQMVKVWVPPTGKPVRGLILSGHGGGAGDSRDFARDANMKALAVRYNFGLAGLHTFPGGEVYGRLAKRFFEALDEFAAFGKHPELRNVPYAVFGSSNGGATAYGFANAYPKRTICFVANVASWLNPVTPSDEALKVPGILVMGAYDPFNQGAAGVQKVREAVRSARLRGARWASVTETKGHEDGVAFDLFALLFDHAVRARYPDVQDPSKGPVSLRDVPESEGWLGDIGQAVDTPPQVASFAAYKGLKTDASWLLDKDLAEVYRGAATEQNSFAIGVSEVSRVFNPNTDPRTMFSIGGPVVVPRRRVRLEADVRFYAGWQSVAFYDGARMLGEVHAPGKPTLTVSVPATARIWCLTAELKLEDGSTHAAAPFYIAVRDPKLAIRSEAESAKTPAWKDALGMIGTSADPANSPATEAGRLVAPGLTAEEEGLWAKSTAGLAGFWSGIRPSIRLDQTHSAREGSEFSNVHTEDAVLVVKAAHSARGLYLLFDVTDNRFMNCVVDPQSYQNTDALDVLFDAKSSTAINDPSNVAQAINAGWALTLTSKQLQVAFGGDEPPKVARYLYPDPWDMPWGKLTSLEDLRNERGIEIRFVRIDSMRRAQEWFIPWAEFGRTTEPKPGEMLGFAPGYNDRDPGESVTKELRWIDHTSPWAKPMTRGTGPRGWGDLVIGPKNHT